MQIISIRLYNYIQDIQTICPKIGGGKSSKFLGHFSIENHGDLGISILRNPIPSGNLTWLLKMAIEIVDFPSKNGDFP